MENSNLQTSAHEGSFRDPAGFVFKHEQKLFRSINPCYESNYELLMSCGLYDDLCKNHLLVAHEEINNDIGLSNPYKIIEPSFLPFISYPYEWSFSMLKEAALLTLKVQERAIRFGMSLKDASAYNVQFVGAKPLFIDTLSFEKYDESKAWVAYRQFCQHFLAPLALASYVDVRLNFLLQQFLDGVPLDLTSRILPFSSKLSFSLFTHIHLHAKSSAYYSNRKVDLSKKTFGKHAMLALLDSLKTAISSLKWNLPKTEWGDYYDHTNYTHDAFKDKSCIINDYLELIKPKSVWDLGANSGVFSELAAEKGAFTLAFDLDPVAVEKNYLKAKAKNNTHLLPLLLDVTNPSPALGWHHQERNSLLKRGPAKMVFALGLLHHLVISNNTPMPLIASFFCEMCEYLVIEFIPKEDSQVQILLSTRKNPPHEYSESAFENVFGKNFVIKKKSAIKNSKRILYLMQKI